MPIMTSYKFGDIILVPFPFTDQTAVKKRPAVVISSAAYNHSRNDLIIMAVASRLHQVNTPGEELVRDWQGAGLLKPSVFKPILATIENTLVLKRLGGLQSEDCRTLGQILEEIIGVKKKANQE
jgi:mRNA interferase MazF